MSKIFNRRLPPEQKLELAKEAFEISGGIPSKKSLTKIYRKLAAKYHPDKGSEPDENRFKIIAAAKEILEDAVANPKMFPVGGLSSTDGLVEQIKREGSGAYQQAVLNQLANPNRADRKTVTPTIRLITPDLPDLSYGRKYIDIHYPLLVDQPAVPFFADFKTRLAQLKAELTHHEPLNVFPGESIKNMQGVKRNQFAYALSKLPEKVKTNPGVIRHAQNIATALGNIADVYEKHSMGRINTSRVGGITVPPDEERKLLRLSPKMQRAADELEEKIDEANYKYRARMRAADKNYDANKDNNDPWMRFVRLHNAKSSNAGIDHHDMYTEQAISNYQARQRRPNRDRIAADARNKGLVETMEKSLDGILSIFHETVSGSKIALESGVGKVRGKLNAGTRAK